MSKYSFEESRRVWNGNGFLKFKNQTLTKSKLIRSKFIEYIIFGQTSWSDKELNIFKNEK